MAVARETLERALQLSYQLNLELNFMTDWLDHLVTEIQKTEGTFVDNPNSAEEIRFYEVGFLSLRPIPLPFPPHPLCKINVIELWRLILSL